MPKPEFLIIIEKAILENDIESFLDGIAQMQDLAKKEVDEFTKGLIAEYKVFDIDLTKNILKNIELRDEEVVIKASRMLVEMSEFNEEWGKFFPIWVVTKPTLDYLSYGGHHLKDSGDSSDLSEAYENALNIVAFWIGQHQDFTIIGHDKKHKNHKKNQVAKLMDQTLIPSNLPDDKRDELTQTIWQEYKKFYNSGEVSSKLITDYLSPIMNCFLLLTRIEDIKILFDAEYSNLSRFDEAGAAGEFRESECRVLIACKGNFKYAGSIFIHELTHCLDNFFDPSMTSFFSYRSEEIQKELKSLVDRENDVRKFFKRIVELHPDDESRAIEVISYLVQEIALKSSHSSFFIGQAEDDDAVIAKLRSEMPYAMKFLEEIFIPKCIEYVEAREKYWDLYIEDDSPVDSSDLSDSYGEVTAVATDEDGFRSVSHEVTATGLEPKRSADIDHFASADSEVLPTEIEPKRKFIHPRVHLTESFLPIKEKLVPDSIVVARPEVDAERFFASKKESGQKKARSLLSPPSPIRS